MLNFYRQPVQYYKFSGNVTAMGFPQQMQVMLKLLFSARTLLKINSCHVNDVNLQCNSLITGFSQNWIQIKS